MHSSRTLELHSYSLLLGRLVEICCSRVVPLETAFVREVRMLLRSYVSLRE
jgi:hypothetical protein